MSDVEPGYYEAISARALCDAGKFVLCGQALRAFSFRHVLQLEALGIGPWGSQPGEAVTIADFILTAAVCASTEMLTDFPTVMAEDLARFDLEEAWATWAEYARVCYLSRPNLWKHAGGGGSHCKAPLEEYVTAFIMRHANGYSREWIQSAPVGEVLWIFEALAEQVGRRSRILTAADAAAMEAESTPAAERARARREKTAGEIFRKVRDAETRMKLLKALDSGTLSKTWRSELRGRKSGAARKGPRATKVWKSIPRAGKNTKGERGGGE